MNTVANHNKRSLSLAAWVLAFPLLAIASISMLPRFTSLHGTFYEKLILSGLILFPLMGVFGIVKHARISLLARIFLAFIYLALGAAGAMLADIYLGCSWARACF
jgi:hypothetical protein